MAFLNYCKHIAASTATNYYLIFSKHSRLTKHKRRKNSFEPWTSKISWLCRVFVFEWLSVVFVLENLILNLSLFEKFQNFKFLKWNKNRPKILVKVWKLKNLLLYITKSLKPEVQRTAQCACAALCYWLADLLIWKHPSDFLSTSFEIRNREPQAATLLNENFIFGKESTVDEFSPPTCG